MKTFEKIWLIIVTITLVSAIPYIVYFPFEPYGKLWTIACIVELMATILYSLFTKSQHNQP